MKASQRQIIQLFVHFDWCQSYAKFGNLPQHQGVGELYFPSQSSINKKK